MDRLNNKGFTLIEVLAVVVILGLLATIMMPIVGNIINQNKEDNYKNLEKSILSAAKIYMSDNRYNIILQSGTDSSCSDTNKYRYITSPFSDSKLSVDILVNNKYLSTSTIKDPRTNKELILSESFILVKYSCDTRDYVFISEFDCSDDSKSCLTWSSN